MFGNNDLENSITMDQMKKQMATNSAQAQNTIATKPADIQFRSALVGAPTQSQLQANSGNDMQAFGSPSTPGAMASAQSNPLGSLAQGYQLNTMVAPKANTSGLDAERGLAGNGPDGFLSKQLASNQMNTMGQIDNSNKSNQNSYYNTLSNMAQNGGASGAARERAISNSDRNAFSSDQNIAQAGAMKGLDIQGAGLQKQFDMNNTIQNQDNQQYNAGVQQAQNQQAVQQYNIGNTLGEIQAQRGFDQNKYNTDMSAWAGGKAADAQKQGASSGGGGCCFIFMEARYGNGTMDEVVRKFRDENLTPKNRRGYYKLSEVLVPLMRRHWIVKGAVRIFMTDPLVAYGKAHYKTGSKIGLLFKPLVNFWLKTFDYLGSEHEFVRENGEVI